MQWAGAGVSVPLLGFEMHSGRVEKGMAEEGLLGLFKGGLTATAGGICGALVFAYLAALIFRPKMKE